MAIKSGKKKQLKTTTKQLKKSCSNFRFRGEELNEKTLKILFYIGQKSPGELVFQKEVSKALNLPESTANYHFLKLREKGFLSENNNITNEGKKAIQHFVQWDKTQTKKIRAHKIQISTHILKLPSNFFNLKHKTLRPFTNSKYRGLKRTIEGSRVLFYSNNKLLLILPDVYGNTQEEILAVIDDCLSQLYQVLELEYPGLKLGSYEVCKFNSMHCAITNSLIAESHLLKTGTCFQSENVCVDNSHGLPELECETLQNIHETMNILTGYEDILQENLDLKNNIFNLARQNLESIKKVSDNNLYINAKKNLAKLNDESNKMQKLRKTSQIPHEYGTYFL